MKSIRLASAVVFLLASAVSATVFQPTSDRQLVDRSDSVVVATVREATAHLGANGYVVTDYRFDVEETLKGTAAGTITVSEIGGTFEHRFTFISDSATYTPGERVLVFLKRRSDGTYFTTSMALGKFAFTRTARGEAALTRDVSELRDDPARLAEEFKRFVEGKPAAAYTTKLSPIAATLHPIATSVASDYTVTACGTPGCFPARVQGGEAGAGLAFHSTGTLAGVDGPGGISNAAAAWTGDPDSGIVLTYAGTSSSSTPDADDGQNVVYLGYSGADIGICDGGMACTFGVGNFTHHYPAPSGPEFVGITDADIIVRPGVSAAQYAALITHELGHAIGLRHSDQGTPSSSAAIMTSTVNATFGFVLQSWDHEAVSYVYGTGPACHPPTSVSISGGGAVPSGQSATLFATVNGGNGTLTYAWFEGFEADTTHPVGSNSSSFTTPPITDTKNYWVMVSNGCGHVNASTTVTVQTGPGCTMPVIATHPGNQTISSGNTATLSVSSSGSQPLSYQWYRATSNFDTSTPVGSNSPQFTTPALTQTTSYWVKVSNACGFASSNVATITVQTPGGDCPKPSFSVQPASSNPDPGAQTYLFAFATGATSYQWYKGTAGDTSTPVDGSSPSNARWINQVFVDLLGRSADPASASTYGTLLGSGTPRATVALSVLTSTEYRNRLLTSFYATFLHRVPSAAELTFWLPAFAANLSDEQIEAQILGSPEYLALSGGTNSGWINRAFNDVLGRTPSAGDVTSFTSLLGSSSRTTTGLYLLTSNEAANRRVQQYYSRFLHRSATTPEASGFTTALLGGTSNEQVIAQILAADEYFNFGTLLVTDAITVTTRYWVRATNTCGTTDSTTAVLTIPQCTPPVIEGQPQSATGKFGVPISIGVVARGATSYQWYRAQSGDPSNLIAGATGPVLTVVPHATGFTDYWVKVTNSCGSSANSNTATIQIDCAPRVLTISTPPTALSATSYTVSWNGDAELDTRNFLDEATKADFSDAVTFEVSASTNSRSFTHAVTADTRYYYRVANAPLCGGLGSPSRPSSTLVTAPQASTQSTFDIAQPPCSGPTCTVRQPLFIPGFTAAGKTALATGDTFSVSSDKAFITVSPSSGDLPTEGVTVTLTIDASQLDFGATQASVTVSRTHAAGKTGAFSDPPATNTVPVSISVVAPVTPTPKDPNAPFNALLIPAIAHADGIGTRFVSDVRLTNTAAQSISYQLTYTPANSDGTQTGKQTTITVAAGDTKALNDIVKDWYGSGTLGEPGVGSLEIRPTNYAGKDPVSISLATVASSRTYSVTSQGTFGQFIPALQLANFLGKSDTSKISLQQVAQSSAYRTNLGFVEGSGQPVDFVATLLDDNGNKLAERSYSLKPFESQQIPLANFFAGQSASDARVEVRVTSDTGRVSAYASVLDNTTTDPLLVFPVDASKIASTRFIVPGVAEFDNGFSNFHTDMRVFNGGSSASNVTLLYYPQGSSSPAATTQVSIAAGEVKALDNVLVNQFKLTTGNGSVVATTPTDSSLVVTARTFSRDKTTGGTFGQFIPGVTSADSVGNGDRALQIVQLEESPAFRTNLGLVEVTGSDASVELLAYSPDSKVASRTVVPLAAGQYIQKGAIFKSLGFSNVYNGRITAKVISGSGRIAAYGSVVDNRTTDPTYVPSQ